MRISKLAISALCICVLFAFVLPKAVHAVPALRVLHQLSQPDGTTFQARQWGDEWNHGWETKDGYTILFDRALDRWVYAVTAPDGMLKSSGHVIGLASPPSAAKGAKPVIREDRGTHPAAGKPRRAAAAAARKSAATSGTNNILVVLSNFVDTSPTYTSANFENVLFGVGGNSMTDYYGEVSRMTLTVSSGPSGVQGWVTVPDTHDYYGADTTYLDANVEEFVLETAKALDATGFNFAPYDRDGDCYVDTFAIIYQGTEQSSSGTATDIWPHSYYITDYATETACSAGGKIKIHDYIVQGEIASDLGMATIGTFVHEYGHAIGLPDLYDTDGSSEGAGEWSLIAGGSWNMTARPGDSPAHLDAWSKYYLGWISPTTVTGTTSTLTINPVETGGTVYKIGVGSPTSGEYYLIENRQLSGFDSGLPGSGLLIWHIDGDLINSLKRWNSVNMYECVPGMPSCDTYHYGVGLVQADNAWDLELGVNRGDAGDPYPGTSANTTFNKFSSPSNELFSGDAGFALVTGITTSGADITAVLQDNRQSVSQQYSYDSSGDSSSNCFIATAAYGSYLDPHVMTLRTFRDRHLLTNAPGRAFVALYYRTSPPLAAFIAKHEVLQALVRLALFPVILLIEHPSYLFLACLLFLGGAVRLRSRTIGQVNKA